MLPGLDVAAGREHIEDRSRHVISIPSRCPWRTRARQHAARRVPEHASDLALGGDPGRPVGIDSSFSSSWSERSDARGHKTTGEKWAWVLTDPLGAMNRQMDKLFGHDVKVELRPFVEPKPRFPELQIQPGYADEELSYGLEFSLSW